MKNFTLRKYIEDKKAIMLSIHLPKTGGTTFGKILCDYYKDSFLYIYPCVGNNNLYRVGSTSDKMYQSKPHTIKEVFKVLEDKEIQCIHGHIDVVVSQEIIDWYKSHKKIIIPVTFIRDPIQRAISEIRHYKEHIKTDETDEEIMVLTSDGMTPYLSRELTGLVVCETENFKEDLKKLGFSWDGVSKNITKVTSDVFDVDLISRHNKKDVLLYQRLLDIKSRSFKNKISDMAVSIKNISKKFIIPHELVNTLRGTFVNLFKKKVFEEFYALEDLSFDVKKSEFFGIVGPNGSGKSTLLKILAGVYTTETGSVEINGLISPFLELGIGFNPELSGRDNIYLNSTVLGLSEKEIDKKFDQIVAFSELERFIDQKLKNYSSGMHVRLAFSVAIHANRDILLMDEVLAVGDSSFQKKCIREFHRYKKEGRTVILVSHDLSTIEQYCDRALYLQGGKVMALGNARAVVKKYRDQMAADSADSHKSTGVAIDEERSHRSKGRNIKAKVKEVIFEDPLLGKRHLFATGSDLLIRVAFEEFLDKSDDLNVGIAIFNDKNNYILGINTIIDDLSCEKARQNGFFEVIYKNIPLRTGTYYVTVGLFGASDRIIYDFVNQSSFFEVISSDQNHGLVEIDYEWRV